MSNPNVYTPYGSQTVTWSRTPNFDEAGYQKALEAWQSGGMYGEDGSRSTAMPTREQFTSYIEQPTVRQEVPYWSQTAINNELQAQARLAMAANEASARLGELPIAQQFTGAGIPGITYEGAGVRPIEAHLNLMGYGTPVSQVTPLATPEAARVVGQASGGPAPEQLQALNLSGVAPVQAAPTGGQFGMAAGGPAGGLFGMASGGPGGLQLGGLDTSGIGGVARGPEQGQFGAAQRFVQGPELQRQIDLEGIAQGPVNAGTTAQQAIMSRLSPQLQGERQQLYTQLINQGLRPGGEAFNAAMQGQMQKENDLLLQAAAQGISLDQAARQQQFAEQQSRAMFANQAALSGFGAGMEQAGLFNVGAQQDLQAALATQAAQNQAQQQAFQQRLQAGEFGQEAQLASFGTQQSAADAYNRAIAQNFAQAQAAQQMGNQAIGQNFEQALAAQQAANAAQAQQFGQAVGAGEFDRQRLLAQFGMGQGASEAYNQALAQNQAAQIAVQQANLGRQQQNFGQQMSQAELANAALQQQRQAAIDQNAFYNQALQQMYNQEMGQSQFYNTAVQQALAQQAAIRSLPINEISALLSGGQVNVPQFQGYSGVTVAPAPIFQAGQAAGDFAQRNYANQVGAYNAQMGLLGQLGGAAGTALGGSGPLATKFAGLFGPSDRRLKSNIVRVGTHPLGIGIYEYDIFGERQRGVMADEVEAVMPEAVATHSLGFKMVNYGML